LAASAAVVTAAAHKAPVTAMDIFMGIAKGKARS
jgi:hypothetical protein